MRLLQGTDNALSDKLEKMADQSVKDIADYAKNYISQVHDQRDLKSGQIRIYIDGGFDLPHSGHYNAIRQARNMGDHLVLGVNSDEDLLKNKGPTVLNVKERAEILRHCKFVDRVVENTPYTPSFELVESLGCYFYAHGDDPCVDSDGVDILERFRSEGRLKMFKRTEGVSTTDLTGRLLSLAKHVVALAAEEQPAG
jgi:ethanolamine-phosphate cytidylyltransferase